MSTLELTLQQRKGQHWTNQSKNRVTEFRVDSNREWTPYTMSKRGKRVAKRFSDHLGIKMSVKMKKVPDEWKANKEIINFKTEEGWEPYKTATNKAADKIAEIANDRDLSIDEVREKICSIDERIQKESFGTIWIKPKTSTRQFYFFSVDEWVRGGSRGKVLVQQPQKSCSYVSFHIS